MVGGAATTAAACSAMPGGMGPGDGAAPRPDGDGGPDPNEPFVDLDGGLPSARLQGWRPPGGADLGPLEDYPIGSWRYHAGARVLVARDRGGLYAYSAVCTHEGCLLGLPDEAGRTECACHGSIYDGLGHVVRGPSTTNLRHYAVTVARGRVLVDPSQRVPDETRAVPEPPVTDAGMTDGGGDAGPSDARADGAATDTARDTMVADVDPCSRGRDVGPLSMFPRGSWTLLMGPRLVLGRDALGLFAFTALCTHSACTVEPPNPMTGAIRCACHGSEYDGNGVVTRGPARENLDHFLVRVCGDRVRVDTAVVVATSARTSVP